MFKVGDKVKVKDGYYQGYSPGSKYNIPREHGVVCSCAEGCLYVKYGDRITPPLNPEGFELVEETHFPLYSEEEAVKLLTERGYEVKAPPEPLKGKVVIYRNCLDEIWTISKEQWDQWGLKTRQTCTVIAIVDWTEGQGI